MSLHLQAPSAPGDPVDFSLSPDVLSRLREELDESRREEWRSGSVIGVLLGPLRSPEGLHPDVVAVEDVEFVRRPVRQSPERCASLLRSIVQHWTTGQNRSLIMVGVVTLQEEESGLLALEHISLFRGAQVPPGMMWIRVLERPAVIRAFLPKNGRLDLRTPQFVIPWADVAVEEPPAKGLFAPPILRWLAWVGAAAVVILAAAGAYTYLRETPKPIPVANQTAAPSAFPLIVSAEPSGNNILINWRLPDRDAATGGEIDIFDGEHREHIELNNAQLSIGKLVYTPRTPNCDLRIFVLTPKGEMLHQWLRVSRGPSGQLVPARL